MLAGLGLGGGPLPGLYHLLTVHTHGLSFVHGPRESEKSASSPHKDTNPIALLLFFMGPVLMSTQAETLLTPGL